MSEDDRIYEFDLEEVLLALSQYAISRGDRTPYDCLLGQGWVERLPNGGLRMGLPRKPAPTNTENPSTKQTQGETP